jgi:DUF1680 family protein
MRQDDIPIKDQREIEGHAVMAGFLFNGVTQYVGATGDSAYREAVLSVWDDFVNHRMFLHGAGGNQSAKNEGYRKNPDCINPDDTYGESCSVFANYQWGRLASSEPDTHSSRLAIVPNAIRNEHGRPRLLTVVFPIQLAKLSSQDSNSLGSRTDVLV